ncbi:MAG: TIGR00268 family protein, partial [Verrucomicrobiota bacterium]|nr:TIGR00268 family protein [Verrucomicrobiota bacterium]
DELQGMASEFPDWWVLNGTNADDVSDYRPGLKAAQEFKVHSPLVDCNIDKIAVRELAEYFRLDCWDKPASPCLSSRVPYGEQITFDKLRQIESAETIVQDAGFPINRVRHYGNYAQVEVPCDAIQSIKEHWELLEKKIIALGFSYVRLDTEGFVSGKLNRTKGA